MTIPQKFIAGLETTADKIRALDRAGFARADIARFLGIRYQHVRNTLVSRKSAAPSDAKSVRSPRTDQDSWPVARLLEAGFELLGDCQFADDAFNYSAKAPASAGVYVFAVDGFVRYVGLTRSGLRTRLSHYVYGHTGQRTSFRIKGLIIEALRAGHSVQVLIAQPPELSWNGLPVDGPSGLETGLIKLIKPAWNQQGNRE